jgi:ribosomal protein S12 methylthiotransferase
MYICKNNIFKKMTIAIRANIITMGCSKNLVDSEKLAYQLKSNGWEVEHEADIINHNYVFINTCGFIHDAKEESIQMILDMVSEKSRGNIQKLVVFGCLVQRYFNELKAEIPEVDFWMGNYETQKMMSLLKLMTTGNEQRINSAFGHYAFLKIAEGCDRKCAFCAIPLIKGKYISRTPKSIIDEAKYLADNGVRELLVIAQDLSYYGLDQHNTNQLPALIENLTRINGIEWIRLHYLYPNAFPEKILDMMAENPKICSYLDIPLQHINDDVLKKMRRSTNRKTTERILNLAREKVNDIAIRTTMLVGHPGETEDAFNELLDFVKEQKFERLGVFTYSEEENTFGGEKYPDLIPEEIKNKRAEILMEVQSNISEYLNSRKLGKQTKVIVDRHEEGQYICRSEYDSVEIDNEIILDTTEKLESGTFCMVEIIDSSAFELQAKLINILT